MKPPIHQSPTSLDNVFNEKDNGFTIGIDYYEISKDDQEEINNNLTLSFFTALKEEVIKEVPSILTFSNFLGEAEEYMAKKKVPFNVKIREQYAIAIYNDFIKNLDNMLEYNKEDSSIIISPYIFSLEYGDFYRPGLQFISKIITKWCEHFSEVSLEKEQ